MNHMIRKGYCLIQPDEKEEESFGGMVLPGEDNSIQAEGTLLLNGDTEDAFPLNKKVIYNKTRAIEITLDGEKYHLVDEKFVFISLNVL